MKAQRPTASDLSQTIAHGRLVGNPGEEAHRVLHEAAPTFVELLSDLDGIGVAALDQNASLQMPVTATGAAELRLRQGDGQERDL
jgi:hypothetical protein